MSKAIDWTPNLDRSILDGRAAKVSWTKLAAAMRIGRNSLIERARKLGVLKATQVISAPSQVVLRVDRAAYPAGHPMSWGALTALTPSIDPAWPAYEPPRFARVLPNQSRLAA